MISIVNFLLEPLEFEFIRTALLVTLAIGLSCAWLSCFLVLKGWSLMGDAISHAVLPGLIIAYIIGIPMLIGAFFSGISVTFLTAFIKDNSKIKEDTAMGISYASLFAIGLLLINIVHSDIHFTHIIYGDVLGINSQLSLQIIFVSLILFIILTLKHKDLVMFCFDKDYCSSIGFSNNWLKIILMSVLAITIVMAVQIVGVILVIAMLIIPGSIGFLLTKSFNKMLVFALLVSIISSLFGIIFSYHFDVSTGPLIVVLQACCLILAIIINTTKTIFKNNFL